ncbi:MAG: oligosaccharide flippase family protein [Gemmatimonadota bacterium]|nr:oligosaccharide flippase family protein [Gemmatimonadota bacterium]
MARVSENAVFITVEKGAHLLGGMLLLVGVARLLGESGLADYAFVIGLTAFFVPILDAGTNNRIIKASASGPAHGRIACREALSFKLAMALPSLAIMAGVAWMIGAGPDVALAVLLVGVSTVSMSMGDGLSAVFKGLQRSGTCAMLMLGLNVLLLASGTGAMITGRGLVGVAICYLVCRAGYLAAGFVLVRRAAGELGPVVRPGFNRRRIVDGLKHLPAAYYLINLLSLNYLTIYYQTGGGAEAGYLAVGYRLSAALLVLTGASFEAVLPALSTRLHDRRAFAKLVVRSAVTLAGIAIAASVAVTLMLEPAVTWFLGQAWLPALPFALQLVWCVPPFVLCGLAHTTLLAAHEQGRAAGWMLVLVVAGAGAGVFANHYPGVALTAFVPAVTGCALCPVLWWLVGSRREAFRGSPAGPGS